MKYNGFNIYLDTTNTDFALFLFNENFEILDKVIYKDLKKKVDIIPTEFENLLKRNNIKIELIKGLYTNIGPGFFTGVRAGFVFLRTLSLLNEIDFYITRTFEILSKQINKSKIYLNAQGQKMYEFDLLKYRKTNDYENSITIIDCELEKISQIKFEEFSNNFPLYKDIFIQVKPLEIEPLYIKKPQIGGI
ncbi:hypothetical protein RRG55_00270 [Mycoplasmopsis felis]|uniref:hypothetical protein n=1 Tax=Mycoplasmopsis felis TaxID=33923 RepID=UPI002AFEC5AE|nr:hypothetical protein [Mycoplasmopsis felis]WQQ03874.1 hypothetical protein RRG47_03550 [Mycoplasmopsis felis]